MLSAWGQSVDFPIRNGEHYLKQLSRHLKGLGIVETIQVFLLKCETTNALIIFAFNQYHSCIWQQFAKHT